MPPLLGLNAGGAIATASRCREALLAQQEKRNADRMTDIPFSFEKMPA